MGLFSKPQRSYAPQLSQMLENLKQKYAHLQTIDDLTARQAEQIQADEVQALMDNITQRQQAIDHIDTLDAQMTQMSQTFNLPEKLSDAGDMALMKQILALYADMEQLLQKISKTDQANAALAQQRLEMYRRALRQANDGIKGIEGYSASVSEGGLYFDQKQ